MCGFIESRRPFRRNTHHDLRDCRTLYRDEGHRLRGRVPVDCIHPKKTIPKHATEEMLYIDPVECIDCGACVPVCPVSAIFALDDLPEKWKDFTERNAKYFGR